MFLRIDSVENVHGENLYLSTHQHRQTRKDRWLPPLSSEPTAFAERQAAGLLTYSTPRSLGMWLTEVNGEVNGTPAVAFVC